MSEERLNEIKDSVNFQRELLLAYNMNTLCVDEGQELIEEINRLNNIINELEKYIKAEAKIELYKDKTSFRTFADSDDILDKLKALKENK